MQRAEPRSGARSQDSDTELAAQPHSQARHQRGRRALRGHAGRASAHQRQRLLEPEGLLARRGGIRGRQAPPAADKRNARQEQSRHQAHLQPQAAGGDMGAAHQVHQHLRVPLQGRAQPLPQRSQGRGEPHLPHGARVVHQDLADAPDRLQQHIRKVHSPAGPQPHHLPRRRHRIQVQRQPDRHTPLQLCGPERTTGGHHGRQRHRQVDPAQPDERQLPAQPRQHHHQRLQPAHRTRDAAGRDRIRAAGRHAQRGADRI